MLSFTVGQVEQDAFEPYLVLIDVADTTAPELERAVRAWSTVLQLTGKEAVLERDELEASDPWFGFGVRVGKKEVLGESAVVAFLEESSVPVVAAFIETLISFNKKNERALEGGLVTHEEYETGSGAIEWMVKQDLKHLPLYLEYRATLDLEHTLEQVNVVLRLSKKLRSSAIGCEWFESVVFRKRRFLRATIPSLRMRRTTRFLPTRRPFARKSRCIRGLPYARRPAL
ncbi:hypothetical protein BH09MYX1_BH09MYX1_03970 [soil metagenome]